MSGTRRYDAIVVGAGPGGLSAALYLALKGRKVLVAEKNGVAGGNCSSRTFGDYTFDMAVHQLSGIGGRGNCAGILRAYGIHDQVEFRQVDPFLVVDMPDRSYVLRGGRDEYRAELLKDFPRERRDIERMMRGLAALKSDTVIAQRLLYGSTVATDGMMAEIGLARKLAFPLTFLWNVMSRMNSSADSMLRRWVRDERLRAVVHAAWPYLGLPPSRLSGVMMNVFAAMQHMEHTYYPVGSSQKVADAMVRALRANGGELLLNSPVRKILVEKGRAAGVEFRDGGAAYAGTVVANAAPLHVYRGLLGGEHVPPRFLRRLEGLPVSLGPFRVCLGLDYDVTKNGLPDHEYLIYSHYDHEETYRRAARGEPDGLSVYSPTRICPGLAPPGHSTLVLTTFLPLKTELEEPARREELAGRMISVLERGRLPGLSGHIKFKRVFTPGDYEKLTNTTAGAMYGWANSPDQVLLRRFGFDSPLPGLHHVGHWTRPGTGVTTAILSGWLLGERLCGPFYRRWL